MLVCVLPLLPYLAFPVFLSLFTHGLEQSCIEPIIYCVQADGRAI